MGVIVVLAAALLVSIGDVLRFATPRMTSLMRILVRVVWRMLKHKEPYQAVTQGGAA
jgi:hypothetical protein